jgi:hypothetical protein
MSRIDALRAKLRTKDEARKIAAGHSQAAFLWKLAQLVHGNA